MNLFTAEEEMQIAVRSMPHIQLVHQRALETRDSISVETIDRFKREMPSLIGSLGVHLRVVYTNGEVYPLHASVRFSAIDAHKLVTHMPLLNEFTTEFRRFYGLAPKSEEVLQVKFTFAGSTVPAVPSLRSPTYLTIIVDYGPAIDNDWMFGEVTL